MVISVMAPHANSNGNTITSIFLALALGNMKKKVLVTHTGAISNSFYQYMGLQQFEDKTSTPTQIVKLLKEGAIQANAIPDYCKKIVDDGEVYCFTNNKTNFSDEDMRSLSEYFVKFSDFEYIIYDYNDFECETADYILKNSDVVVLNFTQSCIELERFKNEREKYQKLLVGKKLVLVCNKFSSIIGTDKDVLKRLGVSGSCSIIHYNPWVGYACNNGSLLELYKNIKRKFSKVAELFNDTNRLAIVVSRIKIITVKAKQQEKKEKRASAKGETVDAE